MRVLRSENAVAPGRTMLLALMALAGGCEDTPGDPQRGAPLRYDSAGVEIVVNAAPAPDRPSMRLSPEPIMVIGVASGDSLYELRGITGLARSTSGEIAVGLGVARVVRVYRDDGKWLKDIVGNINGVQHFSFPAFVRMTQGDSIVIADSSESFGRYTPEGIHLRESPLPGRWFAGYLPGGVVATLRAERDTGGGWRFMADLLDLSGNVALTVDAGTSRADRRGAPGSRIETPPFLDGRLEVLALSAADNIDGSIRIFEGGRLARIARTNTDPRPVTDSMALAWETARVAAGLAPEARPASGEMLPAISALQISRDGLIWVRQMSAPGDAAQIWYVMTPAMRESAVVSAPDQLWYAFGRDGTLLESLILPRTFTPYEFNRDYVLGVVRDAQQVDFAVLYGLERIR